jgi:hypothetical protein
MSTTTASKPLTSNEILAIAHADAVSAYANLDRFTIEMSRDNDQWTVVYRVRQPDSANVGKRRVFVSGGGPKYIIDAFDGKILMKTYYQ